MKLRFIWNQEKDVTEVDVISHPHNQERLQKIEALLETPPSLTVKDPKTIVNHFYHWNKLKRSLH